MILSPFFLDLASNIRQKDWLLIKLTIPHATLLSSKSNPSICSPNPKEPYLIYMSLTFLELFVKFNQLQQIVNVSQDVTTIVRQPGDEV